MCDGRINGDEQVKRFKYGERIGEVFDDWSERVQIELARQTFAVAFMLAFL